MFKSAPHAANTELAVDKMPAHVAIIMDGNGRWAKSRGLPRALGHKKGAEALRDLLKSCGELGLQYLTIYAFSAENWNRPSGEVSDLMELLRHYLRDEMGTLQENNIRLKVIGDLTKLDQDIYHDIQQAEAATANNSGFYLNVALSYGSRQELVQALRRLAQGVKDGRISLQDINENAIAAQLYTQGIPDPDLLIRTGGDQRLSNFLLWQSAYTELYFSPVLWPDFTITHFKEALSEYAKRERRYGTTTGQ